jgi:hypothetical protein
MADEIAALLAEVERLTSGGSRALLAAAEMKAERDELRSALDDQAAELARLRRVEARSMSLVTLIEETDGELTLRVVKALSALRAALEGADRGR